MAGLVSTGIAGFIASAKFTGKKILNAAGEMVSEIVEDFVSGFAGHGWKIWEYMKGKWMLEIDSIRVRGQFTVFELLVSKIRAIIGSQAITQACGKIKEVRMSDNRQEYLITIEDEHMSFMEHDFIRCQVFKGNVRMYHVEISSVVDGVIHVPVSEFELDDEGQVINPPVTGDDIVQFGNSSYDVKYAGRHSAIYMHADEGMQPAIDILDEIYSKDWSRCLKVRLGGDLPGTGGLKGLYCVNGMIKGTDKSGHETYCIYPDGTAEFGDGSAYFSTDKSGYIAGGAISWAWNEARGKYVCTMGDVILGWGNLDDDVKENIKGEPGKDGKDGADGVNGADGVDGTSIIWQGSFASHPANPQNGWAYKNTTDGKSYVYQSGSWYQMTVDGVDGANGVDGTDGLDIVWKGDSSTPPANPVKNWVYRDTDNGRVYIYNGTAWVLMVADGNDGVDGTDGADGTDGLSVFITYHDSKETPSTPTGDGTTGGWHTNSTNAVVWMSQKVAASASSGTWGAPIKIKGNDGADGLPGSDADVPSWVKEWDTGKVQIGDKFMISPALFTGKNTGTAAAPVLTGILQGDKCITIDGVERSGIFALVENQVVFELDPENRKYKFKGDVDATSGNIGGWVITEDGISSEEISQSGSGGSGKNRTVLKKDGTIYGNLLQVALGEGLIRSMLWDYPIMEWGDRTLAVHGFLSTPFELVSAIIQPSGSSGGRVYFKDITSRTNCMVLEPTYREGGEDNSNSIVYYRLPAGMDFSGVTLRLFNPATRTGDWKACKAVLVYNISLSDDSWWYDLSGKTAFLGNYTGTDLTIPPGKMVVLTGVREQVAGGNFGEDKLKWYVEVPA